MRAAVADRGFDLGEIRARAPAVARAAVGGGGCSSMVSSRSATGWPIAAQSGDTSSRACISASRSACSRDGIAQFGKPGPAQQRPQRRIAQRGPVELAEMRVAAADISAAADRTHHTATGRPCGPSARGRRRRRAVENVMEFFPRGPCTFRQAHAPDRQTAPPPVLPSYACKSLKTYTNSQEIQMWTDGSRPNRRLSRNCLINHALGAGRAVFAKARLSGPARQVKGLFAAVPQIERNWTANRPAPPQTSTGPRRD